MAGQVYFISADSWENYGFINSNIDITKLKPIILRVQKTRIEPILGTFLYDKIVTDLEGSGLTGLYKTLMDNYIQPTLIAYSDWKYTFHGTSQMTNKTVGKANDQHITSNTTDDNNDLRDELLKDASQFKRKMIGWLQDNKDPTTEFPLGIPEYRETDEDKCHQSIFSEKRKGGWMDDIVIA